MKKRGKANAKNYRTARFLTIPTGFSTSQTLKKVCAICKSSLHKIIQRAAGRKAAKIQHYAKVGEASRTGALRYLRRWGEKRKMPAA
ncbi:MAG: hypothetical protein E7472_06890 [Ruminococcaceae bacterium]|nr:hypothetical protein [Oscillospiraceae bacterium]